MQREMQTSLQKFSLEGWHQCMLAFDRRSTLLRPATLVFLSLLQMAVLEEVYRVGRQHDNVSATSNISEPMRLQFFLQQKT